MQDPKPYTQNAKTPYQPKKGCETEATDEGAGDVAQCR